MAAAGSNVVTMRRNRGWYLAAAASVVALVGGLVVVTQLRNDDGTTPIDQTRQPSTDAADMTSAATTPISTRSSRLLSSGLPLYDYQPAATWTSWSSQNDVVVRAELTQGCSRDAGPAPADLGDLGLTTVSLWSADRAVG